MGAFTSLPIALEPIAAKPLLRAATLAVRHALPVYDASYLDLALVRRASLATFDRALAAAARAEDVRVVGEA